MRKLYAFFTQLTLVIICANLVSCGNDKSSESQNSSAVEISAGNEIDLGLPSGKLWASCNLGADSPEKYGDYYAWGEIEKKDSFPRKGYKYLGTLIGNNISGTEYDVVSNVLKDDWVMPNQHDFKELVDNCKREWVKYNGVNGYKLIGPNGNSIFLPATGFCDPLLCNQESIGFYWSSTDDNGFNAIALSLSDGKIAINKELRYHGHAIRPIKEHKSSTTN